MSLMEGGKFVMIRDVVVVKMMVWSPILFSESQCHEPLGVNKEGCQTIHTLEEGEGSSRSNPL